MDPEWAPCGNCACSVAGELGYEKWQIKPNPYGEWRSRVCPRKLITYESRAWIQMYSTYQAGFLLEDGGIWNQPALFISVMTLIENLKAMARSDS